MDYIQRNINPKGRKTNDCVIRAIACATGKTWQEVYQSLSELGLKMFSMPNDKKVYEKYLEQLGWTKQRMPRFEDNTRYTVKEFAEANPKGSIVVSVAHHLTVLEDGAMIDTWNCSYKSVGNYWTK